MKRVAAYALGAIACVLLGLYAFPSVLSAACLVGFWLCVYRAAVAFRANERIQDGQLR